MIDKIKLINQGLTKRFGKNDPFRIITRLAEECGELAAQVNHFEGSGIKRQKHGEPDKDKMAKEVQDVIRCALQIAEHYQIEAELEKSVDNSIESMKKEKLI
jgi:NTP pyrophosphatase (non-canonical NTP hydrolase)